jgi:hypothetical protein
VGLYMSTVAQPLSNKNQATLSEMRRAWREANMIQSGGSRRLRAHWWRRARRLRPRACRSVLTALDVPLRPQPTCW